MYVKTAPSFADAAMGRLVQGTKVLAEGGYEKIFRKTFDTDPEEQLQNSYACYMSTSAGPLMGVLYVSTAKLAFCSDNLLSDKAGDKIEWDYYKGSTLVKEFKKISFKGNRSITTSHCSLHKLHQAKGWPLAAMTEMTVLMESFNLKAMGRRRQCCDFCINGASQHPLRPVLVKAGAESQKHISRAELKSRAYSAAEMSFFDLISLPKPSKKVNSIFMETCSTPAWVLPLLFTACCKLSLSLSLLPGISKVRSLVMNVTMEVDVAGILTSTTEKCHVDQKVTAS
ncbi:unnamed protein product [Thlaspi arvense]|uniref:GRAM domain-containing protein n=1 Tax=Thlaspi arvense TaxID=13288 RepID=A0AAU9RKK5_THLAR|nr:unnamed protein product [Thlaspi arvense]